MSAWHLLTCEIRYRSLGFVLSLLAIAVAAALFVAGPTLIRGYAAETNRRIEAQQQASAEKLAAMKEKTAAELNTLQDETNQMLGEMDKQTKRLMRDLGFNLQIVHADTNMNDLYTDFTAADMPEEYVHTIANAEQITSIVHLVATLQQKYKWDGRTVLLVGVLPEVTQSHIEKKPPMGYNIKPGTVVVGYELAGDRKVGDEIELGDRKFLIAQILPEQGTWEDVMLAVHLSDAQQILDKPGKINQIMALGCRCDEGRLPSIRAELAGVLPDTKITEHATRSVARAEQRNLVQHDRQALMDRLAATREKTYQDARASEQKMLADMQATRSGVQATMTRLVNVTTPLVVLACAVLVGLLSWNNVRERRPEIGLLRALGKHTASIATLFLGKACLLGIAGGVMGCVAGIAIARAVGAGMEVNEALMPSATILIGTLIGAPLVAVMASYLPTLSAIRQDPAVVLVDA